MGEKKHMREKIQKAQKNKNPRKQAKMRQKE